MPAPGCENPDVEIFEQTRVSQSGFSVTLLWAPRPEDVDEPTDEANAMGFGGRARR